MNDITLRTRVIISCPLCGSESRVRLSYARYRKFLTCRKCHASNLGKRSSSWMTGRDNTEAIAKMVATNKANGNSTRVILRMAELHRGRPLSVEHRRKIAESNHRRKLSPKTIELHRQNKLRHWRLGIDHGNVGTGRVGFRKDLGICVRSTWEANFARVLNAIHCSFQYEPRRFSLTTGQSYCPDFLLGTGVYIEVKGYWNPKSKEKFKLFQSEYSHIKIHVLDEFLYYKMRTKWQSRILQWEN